ncbi:MAG: hypothetical protein O7D94_03185 [Planctomycetota bacterium]|nr:hypothetical protein [Planctomycetota bacterium]
MPNAIVEFLTDTGRITRTRPETLKSRRSKWIGYSTFSVSVGMQPF